MNIYLAFSASYFLGEKALSMDSRPTGSNFATVAILAAMEDVPLTAFTMELYHALTAIGTYFYYY